MLILGRVELGHFPSGYGRVKKTGPTSNSGDTHWPSNCVKEQSAPTAHPLICRARCQGTDVCPPKCWSLIVAHGGEQHARDTVITTHSRLHNSYIGFSHDDLHVTLLQCSSVIRSIFSVANISAARLHEKLLGSLPAAHSKSTYFNILRSDIYK